MPDFSALAADFGAVRLSGWNPDETHWLIDMPRDPASRQTWRFDRRDDAWHIESTGRAE